MRSIMSGVIVIALLASSAGFAQPGSSRNQKSGNGNNQQNGQHRGWGQDRGNAHRWNRGERINDYRRYHLQRPRRGYEWRRVDDNYVLAAVAGGVIASVILANH